MKKILPIIIIVIISINGFGVVASASIKEDKLIEKPSLSPDDHFRFIMHGLRIRSYRIHIPPDYDENTPMPVIFVLHGHPHNSKIIKIQSEMDKKADEEGFIVVYPNGETTPFLSLIKNLLSGVWSRWWNCWDFNRVDDVGFIRKLIGRLKENLNINSSRIYITGFSGGAMMTYRLGSELSDIIAAIVPVAGTIGGTWYTWPDDKVYTIPEPLNPLPVIVFHGIKDQDIPYGGGWVSSMYYYSVNESVSFWVNHNNCNSTPEINISESGNIITRTYSNGSDGSEVVLYTIVNGGHEWFGSSWFLPCEISVNDCMWDFFEKHPKK